MNEALYYKSIRCTLAGAAEESVSVYPRFNDVTFDYEREQGEIFYRKTFNGEVTFVGADYDLIANAPYATRFVLRITRWYPDGTTTQLSLSEFYKTDCEFDMDKRNVTVSPKEIDRYQRVLDALDKECNIKDLLPEMTNLTIYKRPLIQIYVLGDDVLQSYTAGTTFEQDSGIMDESELEQYHFMDNGLMVALRAVMGSDPEGSSPNVAGVYVGTGKVGYNFRLDGINNTNYYVQFFPLSNSAVRISIYNSSGTELFYGEGGEAAPSIWCNAVEGSGATGRVWVRFVYYRVYARMLHNKAEEGYPLAEDDVSSNPNYKRVSGIDISNNMRWSTRTSATPTEYGKTAGGAYYMPPYGPSVTFYPVSITQWPDKSHYGFYLSIWFAYNSVITALDSQYRVAQVVAVAYQMTDVIKALIEANGLGVTFDSTSDYSLILFGNTTTSNVLGGRSITPFLVAKANIINGDYRKVYPEPSITLGQIFSMLKNTMQIYWYLDGSKIRLEHRRYFDNGLRYSGAPAVGYDLTELMCPRSFRSWASGRNQYKYDKKEMPERYQFGWMDKVTKPFSGYPIVVNSDAVEGGLIEEVTVENFTSDIDYMLTNPSGVSEDGFAIIGAILSGSNYLTPIVSQTTDNVAYNMQNGLMSYIYLHPIYWLDDMPAESLTINNAPYMAHSVKRTKRQEIDFPSNNYEVDEYELIKTEMGEGQIDKLSVSLTSGFVNAEILHENDG